jgi:hypothetical protein
VVDVLREILAREGVRESRSAEQEGLFFTFESLGEVSLQHNMTEHESVSAGADSFRKARKALVTCLSVLAERGFAVTLVLSPRTIALFARSEPEFVSTNGRPYQPSRSD